MLLFLNEWLAGTANGSYLILLILPAVKSFNIPACFAYTSS